MGIGLKLDGSDRILVINVGVCLICQVNNATARWRQTNNTYVTGHYVSAAMESTFGTSSSFRTILLTARNHLDLYTTYIVIYDVIMFQTYVVLCDNEISIDMVQSTHVRLNLMKKKADLSHNRNTYKIKSYMDVVIL